MIAISLFGVECVIAQDIAIQEQEAAFVREYHEYIQKHQRKWHRKAVRHSNGCIRQTDTLLYVPCFFLKKEIVDQWDFENFNTNEQFACWQSFNLKKGKLEEVYIKDCGLLKEKYFYSKWKGVEGFYKCDYGICPELLELVNSPGFEGILQLPLVGYFAIINGRILYYESHIGKLCPPKDAIASLKEEFVKNSFMPVHVDQALRPGKIWPYHKRILFL